tara:strand:- start:261 stop:650 length:390 start_codon:yes stop_codon:yes gene_type:complete
MHETNWEIKNNRFIPVIMKQGKNCRKFFLYDLKNLKQENFIIIHNETVENKTYNNLKVRLFQNGFEKLINLKIYPNTPIEIFNLREIFKNINNENTLVQIESYDFNFHATGMIFNKTNGNVCTDHFTGG